MKEQSIACITNLHHCCEEAICGVQTHKSAQILHRCLLYFTDLYLGQGKKIYTTTSFEIQLHPHSDSQTDSRHPATTDATITKQHFQEDHSSTAPDSIKFTIGSFK